jgi:stress-induced-phosphoprotein 1
MVDPFGPGMFERIAANPKFAPYLADPAFTAKLRRITDGKDTKARSDALMEALSGGLGIAGMPGAAGAGAGGPQDPRLMEVVMYLLGGAGAMGGGMGGMDVDGEEDDGEDGAAEGDDEEAARAAFTRGAAQGRAAGGPSSAGGYQPPRRDPAAEAAAAAERKKREAEAAAKRAEEEEAALSEEERAKRVAKRQAVARKEEGNKAYKARDFDAALRLYQEAYELDSEDITYLLNAAAVHFERGQWDEAIATCRKALERGGEVFAPYALKAKAWARIGNAEAKRDNLQAAVEAYESSLLESHTDEVYEKAKKAKAELKARAEAAYRDPAKGAEAKERGNELFKAGKFKEAIAEYSDAIRRDPECAAYYSNRAAALTKVMDVSGAMADCDKCLKLDPKFTRGYVRKGNLHFLLKEYHKALDQYQAALALDPECEEAREGMRRTVGKINEVRGATGGRGTRGG